MFSDFEVTAKTSGALTSSTLLRKTNKNSAMLFNNTFTRCSIGQKGSVLYARQISNIIVRSNEFEYNRPSMALYLSSRMMPYQVILLGKTYARPYLYNNDPNDSILKNSKTNDEW